MTRPIKFRAWDKKKKTLEKVSYLDWGRKGKVGFLDRETDFERFNTEVEIMQFTGRKDKNGKEIYEGDIVKFRSHPNKTVEAAEVKWSQYLKWILVWFADDFEREKNYPSHKDLGGHINTLEIIGNIYENPELLNN